MPDIEQVRELAESWDLALTGTKTPPNTHKQYLTSIRLYLAWAEAEGEAGDLLDTATARRWLASIAAAGKSAGTVNVRLASLRAFSRWLLAEGEIDGHGLGRISWAHYDDPLLPALGDDQLAALMRACAGRDFLSLRDAALISFLRDSGARSDEALSLRREGDVDLRAGVALVRRGKGGKGRMVPIGPEAVARMDAYRRARNRGAHPHAADPAYWIGRQGALAYRGLERMFQRRAEQAGIAGGRLTLHSTRRGFAVNWKLSGGSTEGLMAIAGWSDIKMAMRYVRVAEQELAIAEARRILDRRK